MQDSNSDQICHIFPPLPFSGSLLLNSESFLKTKLLWAKGSFTDCVYREEMCLSELIKSVIIFWEIKKY
jgi:hypothetical protein